MLDDLDNLMGADISKEHLSWLHLSMSNASLRKEELYSAYMTKEPDLRGITLRKVEDLIDRIRQRLQLSPQVKHPLTVHEFEEKLYREGLIENIPTRQPLTPEEQAERERLSQVFAGGKPMSEMVIEDRGPY